MDLRQKRAGKKFFRLYITVMLLLALAAGFTGCGKSSKQKIIGKWVFGSSMIYTFNENGEVITSNPGMPDKKEKYSFPDNETLVMEMASGEKMTAKIRFTDNDDTLNITNESGTKHTLKRQP